MATNIDELFEAAAKEFEAAFIRSSQGKRPDEIGEPREDQLLNFLRDWLPQKYGLTNGYVINSKRQNSKQCDIIIFRSSSCPKFILDKKADRRLIPYGELFGTIEVKSTLGHTELSDSLEKIRSVYEIYESNAPTLLHEEFEEIDLDAVEVSPKIKLLSPFEIREHIPDNEWRNFKVRVKKKRWSRPYPISIVFAYRLANGFSLERIIEQLRTEESLPNAIIVLNTGIIMLATGSTVQRYKAIKCGKRKKELELDYDVIMARLERGLKFIKEESNDRKTVLMYFYTYLLDELENQHLNNYSRTDLISIWRKSGQ